MSRLMSRTAAWARLGAAAPLLLAAWMTPGCQAPQPAPSPVAVVPREPSMPLPPAESDMAPLIGAARDRIANGATRQEVQDVLGEPTYQEASVWTYLVDDARGQATATIRFERDRVAGVESTWSPGWQRIAGAGTIVSLGLTAADVRARMGSPTAEHRGDWWTVALPEYQPSRLDLFLREDGLSWGSWHLLSRLRSMDNAAAQPPSRAEVRAIVGEPLAQEPGVEWLYLSTAGTQRVFASVYFRGGKVVAVRTDTTSARR